MDLNGPRIYLFRNFFLRNFFWRTQRNPLCPLWFHFLSFFYKVFDIPQMLLDAKKFKNILNLQANAIAIGNRIPYLPRLHTISSKVNLCRPSFDFLVKLLIRD